MTDKNYGEIIGKNIHICLDEYGMDTISYARMIRVTRQTAANYLSGESVIDSYKLYITAKRFNKSLDWFLEDTHVEGDEVFSYEEREWIRREIKTMVMAITTVYDNAGVVQDIDSINAIPAWRRGGNTTSF